MLVQNQILMLSSVGTSLLTNAPTTEDERTQLKAIANLRADQLSSDETQLVGAVSDRVSQHLSPANDDQWRHASAEVNGILTYYAEHQRSPRMADMHVLVATDTLLGQTTAQMVEHFLAEHQFGAIVTPVFHHLNTKTREEFKTGMMNIIRWCEDELTGYRAAGYHIVFNLTGGFKSIQGYLNTLGMLYADEMVYLFEPPNRSLITIPRLPLRLDVGDTVKRYAVWFGLLDEVGYLPEDSIPDVTKIPELFIEHLIDADHAAVGLSNWGLVIWKREQKSLYSESLLPWPGLQYQRSFQNDFKSITDTSVRIRVQQSLANLAGLLLFAHGNISTAMSDGGLQFERLQQCAPYCSFRVSLGIRVVCEEQGAQIVLHRVGMEQEVYEWASR